MKPQFLDVRHINVFAQDKQILYDISCAFERGKITVLMGPNGSGKSTLAHVIMGDPKYKVIGAEKAGVVLNGKDITNASPDTRAKMGLFLSFQSPVAIPGVSVKELLNAFYHNQKIIKKESLSAFHARIRSVSKKLRIDATLLTRSIHEEFSGGERKKIELLQALIMRPAFAIFDEIDTGVDIDVLQLIAGGIVELQKKHVGIVLITHSERIFRYMSVDRVLVMKKGRIVQDGTDALIEKISKTGYNHI